MPQPEPIKRKISSIISPLRWPGSKKRHASLIAEILTANGLRPRILSESMCGGASVTLQLLADDRVDYVCLGDLDLGVASFWQEVFDDPTWLIEQVRSVELSVKEWKIIQRSNSATRRDQALRTLYLNRTSFSGITKPPVGPIGGLKQLSDYPIGCRFNRPRIVKRIKQAAALSNRVVAVHHGDWHETVSIARRARRGTRLHFLDPPYLANGHKLYNHSFTIADFARLQRWACSAADHWLISCGEDDAADLFRAHNLREGRVETLYTGKRWQAPAAAQEVIFTDLVASDEVRVWRTGTEWNPYFKTKDIRGGV